MEHKSINSKVITLESVMGPVTRLLWLNRVNMMRYRAAKCLDGVEFLSPDREYTLAQMLNRCVCGAEGTRIVVSSLKTDLEIGSVLGFRKALHLLGNETCRLSFEDDEQVEKDYWGNRQQVALVLWRSEGYQGTKPCYQFRFEHRYFTQNYVHNFAELCQMLHISLKKTYADCAEAVNAIVAASEGGAVPFVIPESVLRGSAENCDARSGVTFSVGEKGGLIPSVRNLTCASMPAFYRYADLGVLSQEALGRLADLAEPEPSNWRLLSGDTDGESGFSVPYAMLYGYLQERFCRLAAQQAHREQYNRCRFFVEGEHGLSLRFATGLFSWETGFPIYAELRKQPGDPLFSSIDWVVDGPGVAGVSVGLSRNVDLRPAQAFWREREAIAAILRPGILDGVEMHEGWEHILFERASRLPPSLVGPDESLLKNGAKWRRLQMHISGAVRRALDSVQAGRDEMLTCCHDGELSFLLPVYLTAGRSPDAYFVIARSTLPPAHPMYGCGYFIPTLLTPCMAFNKARMIHRIAPDAQLYRCLFGSDHVNWAA